MSGKAGIEIANKENPDIIILDIIMPDMDGYMVCEALKKSNLTKHIPIILITATNTDSSGRAKGLDLGAVAFLSKPIDNIEFIAQVRVMLRIKEAEDKLRAENENLRVIANDSTSKLLESESRFKELVDMLPEVVFETDENLIITYCNQIAFEIFGYSEEDISKGLNGLTLLAPEDRVKAKGYFEMRMNGLNPGPTYYQGMTKDGSSIPILFHANSIFKDGKFLGVRGIIIDISEQFRLDMKLKESEERYHTLFDSSFDAIFIAEKGVCLEQNSTAEKMFGYNSSEAKGMLAKNWYVLEDRERVMNNVLSRKEDIYKATALRKDGSTFPAEVQGKSINFNGVNQRITVLKDITSRKLVEKELKDSEERFRRAIIRSPNPIMIHNEDSQVLQISNGWTRYSGYTIEDIPTIGDWTELAYGDRKEFAKDYIEKLSEIEETVKEGEWLVKSKSGEMRTWEFFTTPLGTFGDGKKVLLSIAFDITESKKSSEEIQKYKTHLEDMVKERTVELENKNAELERLNNLFVGREFRIKELRDKIKGLENRQH